jgi:hypothetical protein
MIKVKLFLLFTLCCGSFLMGQQIEINTVLEDFVASGKLAKQDIVDYKITDAYNSSKSGVKYLYVQQMLEGIPIDLAINSIFIDKNSQARILDNRFIKNARDKKIAVLKKISPLASIQSAAIELGYTDQENLRSIINTRSDNIFSAAFAENEVESNMVYTWQDNKLILCYKISIDEKNKSDGWSILVDVATGKIIDKTNRTLYCNANILNAEEKIEISQRRGFHHYTRNNSFEDMASYRVYPLPATNPTDGIHELIITPHIPESSPFGWHDTDGLSGAEHTITRGNNVFAYADLQGNNATDDNEPDGGVGLSFDFVHNINEEAESSLDASVVNLFYIANMAHDISYLLGFQEEDGNYQFNNYGKNGKSGDYVRVESMDGSGRNNANFSITSDGNPGRMQMYLFDKIRSLVVVESPAALASNNFEAAEATFGNRIQNNPVQAEIAMAINNDPDFPNQGCGTIITNLNGKIALMDRGTCDFSEKVFYAQEAGAVMAIICNIAGVDGGDGEDIFTMGSGAFAGNVNIPSVMMKKSDCDLIKITLNTDQKVEVSAKERPFVGPGTYDGSFDNGIVLHEYVHGISTRLTGGPSQTGCLNNVSDSNGGRRGDQMGEGWSDFFALVWTTKEGDDGPSPRGMGTFVLGEENSGKGIRTYPYSTDMSINPLTYGDAKVASVPHGVGTVWATMLWDLYWAYIEKFGFDPDFHNETSGNYKAAFTVMEALKMQPCRPGFVDGRNAILEADQVLFSGENETIIWEVFARRGLGYNAEQGSTIDHRDGTEDFSIPPFVTNKMVIDQVTTHNVRPGDQIDVAINLINYTGIQQTNGRIIVQIPEGLEYVVGSSEIAPDINKGNLTFNIDPVVDLENKNLNFRFKTSESIASIRRFYDDVEGGTNGWVVDQRKGSNIWRIDNTASLSGNKSWYTPESGSAENLQRLISPPISVIGERPVFRFWHNYNIREAINGGFIEITDDGGQTWSKINDHFIIRNIYSNELPYLAFGIPGLEGFSGVSEEDKFIDSYIDLQTYKGKEIQLRFRFSQQPGYAASAGKAGWTIDDFELMDLRTYNIQSCFKSNESPDPTCSDLSEIVVNTETLTAIDDLEIEKDNIVIFPNPANETLIVEVQNISTTNNKISIFNAIGKEVYHTMVNKGIFNIEIDTRKLIAGTYFLKFDSEGKMTSRSFQVIH